MVFVSYGLLVLGIALLVLDAMGRFRVARRSAGALRVVGLAALAIPALIPLAAVYGRWWEWSGPVFPVIAHAYTVLAAIYAVAIILAGGAGGRRLSRAAYACLLALAAVPSWALLPIAGPTVGLAGLALARSRMSNPEGSEYQSNASRS